MNPKFYDVLIESTDGEIIESRISAFDYDNAVVRAMKRYAIGSANRVAVTSEDGRQVTRTNVSLYGHSLKHD